MKMFGDNSKAYPEEMRRQLWPLCCGAAILSGFKQTFGQTEDQIVTQIETVIKEYVPDHQVYAHETLCPKLTFLTLNESQTKNTTIMAAIDKAGFKLFATGRPRGGLQHFYVRDDSSTFKLAA